jgi:hypothetical protein
MQIFGKQETSRKFFEDFLNFTINICKKHASIKKDVLKILYDFLFSDVVANKEKEHLSKKALSPKLDKKQVKFNKESNTSVKTEENLPKLKINIFNPL